MPLCHSGGEVSIIQNLFRCPTNGIAVLGAQMKLGDVVPQMTSQVYIYIYIRTCFSLFVCQVLELFLKIPELFLKFPGNLQSYS